MGPGFLAAGGEPAGLAAAAALRSPPADGNRRTPGPGSPAELQGLGMVFQMRCSLEYATQGRRTPVIMPA